MSFLNSEYTRHDHTHDGKLEKCRCERIIQEICPYKDECKNEIFEECLTPYPLYTTLDEVVVSSMQETVLVYTHPSGGTIYHGPIITNLLKKKYKITPINYPYGTIDHGMDDYFIIGSFEYQYINNICHKIGNMTKNRGYKVLLHAIPDVGSCKNQELKEFYLNSLFTILHDVIRGLSVYIQGDNTKIQSMLYVLVGILNIDSTLKFNKSGTIRHLSLAYKKHGKEFSTLTKHYLQEEILSNSRFIRAAYHITEVHGQNILPDPIPDTIILPKIIPPTASAIQSVFNREKYNETVKNTTRRIRRYLQKYILTNRPLGYHLFQRKKYGIRLIKTFNQTFCSNLINSEPSWNTGLYTVD